MFKQTYALSDSIDIIKAVIKLIFTVTIIITHTSDNETLFIFRNWSAFIYVTKVRGTISLSL